MAFRNLDPEIRENYLDWVMTPPLDREPATKKEFAENAGISEKTLQYWDKQPEFQKAILRLKTEWGAKFYPDILGRLVKIIQEGSDNAAVQASKVLLQHLNIRTEDEKGTDGDHERVQEIEEFLRSKGYKVK